jgi:hypothetical protein
MLAIERLNDITTRGGYFISARAEEEDTNYWWRMSLRSILMDVEEPFCLGLSEAPASFFRPIKEATYPRIVLR